LHSQKFGIMPKMKTNSSAKKRFKVTGSGKIMRRKAYHSHILTKKAKDRKKGLTQDAEVFKGDLPRVKRMLCI
jgi:large subunit ribosomal protein L35